MNQTSALDKIAALLLTPKPSEELGYELGQLDMTGISMDDAANLNTAIDDIFDAYQNLERVLLSIQVKNEFAK